MKTKARLIVGVLASLTLGPACHKAEMKDKPPRPVRVRAAEKHSTGSEVRYSASIRPNTQVEVAFKVGGYVEALAQVRDAAGGRRYLQAGDVVSKGAVLARVRQSDYLAKVNQAASQQGEARSALATSNAQLAEARAGVETSRAQVADAQATFDRAALDFERAKHLFAGESIPKPDYDAARAQYEGARARLDSARGQLESAQARVATARAQAGQAEAKIKTAEAVTAEASIPLQDTVLRAPSSAVVLERKVEVGALVGQGTPAFVLADLTSVKAAFGVPDLALQHIRAGDTLGLVTDALPGQEFTGHVSRVSPSADPNSRVFDVEVTIPNRQGLLKPGMIASIQVREEGARAEVTVVPLTAVVASKEGTNAYAVYVVAEQGGKQHARLRRVTLGEAFGNSIAVTEGVEAGELVVTTGATLVADGEQVQVIKE
ncbi:MAG TPA: efflux RND transporter periplasmic adaptor subunit [Pyrinomonadaceae bacterium]|nr:efflux RND transporter periplasmic adaptor subunit [Pyrinomonadaceae bacterium]